MTYYTKPGISYSMLKKLDENPQEFYEIYVNKTKIQPTSKAFEEGKMFDMLLTEPERFNLVYGIKDGKPLFKGDISPSMLIKLNKMVSNLNEYKFEGYELKDYLAAGSFQEEVFWLDDKSFVNCKGKLDWISKDKQIIIDFKTTSRFEGFDVSIDQYKYYLQAGMYCSGIKNIYNLNHYPKYYLIAVDKLNDNCIQDHDITHRIQEGIDEMNKLLKLYNYYCDCNWKL